MDHLFLAHGIAKDAKHPTILSKQAKELSLPSRPLDAGMSGDRFQAICTTRYMTFSRQSHPVVHSQWLKSLSAMSNVLEFCATVHAAWKVIKAETQRNAEMHLCMVLKCTTRQGP